MKRISILLIIAGMFALISCEKDQVLTKISGLVPSSISSPSSGSTYVLTELEENNVMETFTWSSADFGYQSANTYIVQIDKAGNNFATAINAAETYSTEVSVTVGDMNNFLLSAGVLPDVEAAYDVRVIATVHPDVDTLFSSSIDMNITPFEKLIIYPTIYVPGNYQPASGYEGEWSPENAPALSSVKSNDKYEGYVYMANGNNEFKFTDEPNWDLNWGDTGADGSLEQNGDNLIAADAGYYKMNVDLGAMTYTILNTDWGLIGSATPDDWNSDQNMIFDPATKTWSITLDLIVGEIKFRANDGWDLDYGDTGGDGKLDQGGDNMQITTEGNYTITMDLTRAIYLYTVVKNN